MTQVVDLVGSLKLNQVDLIYCYLNIFLFKGRHIEFIYFLIKLSF
jgi:hypothetical protein